MIAVVQRVTHAQVTVAGEIVGRINAGLVALVAICAEDTDADTRWMAGKLATLRIFRHGDKYFDHDVAQIGGAILLISNFTVAAETATGRRPSLSPAAPPEKARVLFDQLVLATRALNIPVETGRFQAEMLVDLQNDGPVTMIVDSRSH